MGTGSSIVLTREPSNVFGPVQPSHIDSYVEMKALGHHTNRGSGGRATSETYLTKKDGRAVVMPGGSEQEVRFDGATGPLRGRLRTPAKNPWGALVTAHGRHEDMDGPLVNILAQRASDLGLWTLRFNFAFRESGTEPSAGIADEIEDLRAAILYARRASGTEAVYVAGRGLGAWATVAAATDEMASGTILLGLAYEGQREREMALRRLAEFDIPTLILVGFESDRVDLPKLESLVAESPSLNLEVLPEADHRLKDARGRILVEPVLMKAEAWLRLRREGSGT